MFHNIPAKQEHIANVHGIRMSGGKYLAPSVIPTKGTPKSPKLCKSLDISSSSTPPIVQELGFQDVTMEIPEIGPIYKCPHCPKGYDITDSLRKHAKNAHDVALGFCRDCQLVFPSHEEKANHVQELHNRIEDQPHNISDGNTPHISSPLQKIHTRQTSITNYLSPTASKDQESCNENMLPTALTIIGMNKSGYGEVSVDEAYQCPKCPKIYAIAKSLRKHCRKVHDELSICFCSTCTNVFTNHQDRDHHVSEGECIGQQIQYETNGAHLSTAAQSTMDMNNDTTPHMGTRKRRISSINQVSNHKKRFRLSSSRGK